MKEILDRAERVGCFTVPSLESVAIEKIAQVDRGPIVVAFPADLDPISTSRGHDGQRRIAVGVLAEIHTPQGEQLFKTRADHPDKHVADYVQWRLKKDAEESAIKRPGSNQGADLIAGNMEPDDLLPPAEAYIWTDEGYVAESEIGSMDKR